jgi:hypothetical protein
MMAQFHNFYGSMMKKVTLSYVATTMIAAFIITLSIDTSLVKAFETGFHKTYKECPPGSPRTEVIRCAPLGSSCQASDQYFCDEEIGEG